MYSVSINAPLSSSRFRVNGATTLHTTASGGRSNLKVGGHMASAERQPIRASEAERFLGITRRKEGNICPFTQLLKVLKYLPNIA